MKVRNVGWNLVGLVFPLVVAFFTVPGLIRNLGQERFGLLALAWGVIGYATTLDLGIGRALNQRISVLRGQNDLTSIVEHFVTARRITALVGACTGATLVVGVYVFGLGWITAPGTEVSELRLAALLVALTLPMQAISATFRAVNEAFHNFAGISVVRAGLGILNFGGPFLVSTVTTNMPAVVASLVVGRLVALVLYRGLAHRCLSKVGLKTHAPYSKAAARRLFGFGAWVTVSSVISPILQHADRFFIAAILTASSVAVYVVPYEVTVQSLVLVGATTGVMFPSLATLMTQSPRGWRTSFWRWFGRISTLMGATCVALFFILPWFLPVWIGEELDPRSVEVGQILTLGVFANSLGSMFYAALHAQGRPDVTAKAHLVELPIFIMALSLMIGEFGVQGAAWTWAGRMILDASILAVAFLVLARDDVAPTAPRTDLMVEGPAA